MNNSVRITKIYYNLIIAISFDVAVSLSNLNKLTKKRNRSARLSRSPPWYRISDTDTLARIKQRK